MGVLSPITVALGLVGCYSPEVRDCTVTCATAGDCTGGQICDGDGFCAMPAMANRCGALATPDASVTPDAVPNDARRIDAMPAPDASFIVDLVIEIGGQGQVQVVGVGTCDAIGAAPSCTYPVLAGVPLVVRALPASGWSFDKWMADACSAQDDTCTMTPTMIVTKIKVRFSHDDDDAEDD